MPELPEVELVRRRVAANCLNRTMRDVEVLDDGVLEGTDRAALRHALTGRSLLRAERHGKQLLCKVQGDIWLTVHLGMTGDLLCLQVEEHPPRYVRVRFVFEDGGAMVYEDMRKFGAIGLTESRSSFLRAKNLGPDALKITKEDFLNRVSRHRRAIKTVLLDQSVVAGIGNLYSDEALFQCRIHPLRSAERIDEEDLICLYHSIRRVLKASIQVGTDFALLPSGHMLSDRSPHALCPRGHGPWETMKVNGRTAYLCPHCQRL